jgi:hypothetical protein
MIVVRFLKKQVGMCMLMLTSDDFITIKPIAKLLRIDEMKLGFKLKDKFN